ncbi:phage tail spike protein [Weissella confusa]|uniref:phage tail spike protein n=1 Tax=Weissella confusa TaxID=1583 RepID=UPI0015F51315|nr:phage tail spike protein [Weissella confusa]
MTPILYSSDEIDFLNNGLGQLGDLYDVDIHEQRNGLLNLTAYYPVNGQHYADISEGNIILAKPSPFDDNHAFRIVSVALDITGYAVMIEADSITYDLTNNLSKTIHMLGDGQAAMTAIQKSTLHPHIFTFYSDITHTSESQLRYVNPMEAIAGTQGSFLQIWGGELKRENRRVAMFNRRGRDNVATFRLGKNIAGLKYTVDVSNLTTEIVPTVTVNSTDVSRTIEGATVQSSRIGNYPLVYSKMVDVSQDVKVDEGDTDDQIKAKINAFAADWFVKSANTGKDLPEVTVEVEVESLQDSADYADKFAKLETIGLTDTVTVYVPEFGVNVTAIVNELHYDPVTERVTKLSIGTAKVSWADSNKNALNDLQDKVTEVKEQANQAVVSANGKNSIYSGRNAPAHPQEGDTWFWDDGTDSGIRVFTNGKWVDSVDTKTLERINNAVDGAIETSKTYTDELNEKQVQNTNVLNDKVDKSVKELTDSQQAISSQATAYTNSAVADANSKAVSIGQSAAQNAQSALDAAKKDFNSSFASQASQTASMASEANSKASQYASQAKSDAIAVATSADGVVRKEFKSTTDSMTATIQKNKSDADGKISTAQTTATQALDGLSTKVSQTEYNTKTGQLQTDLTRTTQTANQAKTDIVSIKQKDGEQDEKMNSIVSDVNGTKQTISDLQTVQGKQSGDIATLQSRADGFEATVTKVNNLAVGGRNLLLGTANWTDSTRWNQRNSVTTDTYRGMVIASTSSAWISPIYLIQNAGILQLGKTYTFSTYVRNTSDTDTTVAPYYAGVVTPIGIPTSLSAHTEWTRVSITFQVIKDPTTSTYGLRWEPRSSVTNGKIQFAGYKLEEGNIATDWTPAPEDLSSATAKAQLTADQATVSINNYKTDADGRIAKAQADITANATAITQKVSQTDYNAKTGELTTSVSKAQQTADTATQTVGAYKETNDKRVTAAETKIQSNADAIKSTVSKTDFDKATGKLSGDISTLQQSAKGFEATITKVNNLSVGGRNLLQGTRDFSGDNWLNLDTIWKKTNETYNGLIVVETTSDWSGLSQYYQVKQGETYTFSLFARYTSGAGTSKIYVGLNSELENGHKAGRTDHAWIDCSVDVNWKKFSVTFTAITDGYIKPRMERTSDNTNVLRVCGLMLEKGTLATDWTPAPEDIDSNIAQVKLTADGLYEKVNNPTTGIATRLLTAEGAVTTVQNATKELTSKQTLTANGLTQEISDRKNGDQAVRTDMATLINQQVTSVTKGYQSAITQTADGIIQQVGNLKIRYVRFASDGNTMNTGNHYQEFALYATNGANLLDGKVATTTGYTVPSQYPITSLTDGKTTTTAQIGDGDMSTQGRWAFFDIGNLVNPDYIAITPYYYDGRRHQNVVVQVSADNLYWRTVYQGAIQTVAGDVARSTVRVPVNGSSFTSFTEMFRDNFAFGIKDNIGNIISGINGDTSGLMLTGKHIFLDGEVTAVGKSWLDGAVIKDATIGRAQIAELSVDSSKIINLDVNKLSGNVANFIRTYWDGRYGSTSIDSEGMTVSAGLTTTVFDKDGMKLSKSGRSVGRIGVNDLYQDFSKKGLYFGLEATGDFMAWGAQNYAGNPYTTKLSWFRAGAVPSNLPGLIEGFNFEDNVAFINPVEMRGGIKLQGANDRLLVRASNLNGGSYPTFGGPSAYFVYAGSDIYLSSNGTAINLTKIAKAFGGIRTAAIPTGFNSNGTATGWYNVDMG